MRKLPAFIITLLLLASLLPLHTDAQVSGPARTIRYGSALPSTCQPNGNNVFVKTSATTGQYFCSATNTWTVLATGSGVSEPANQIVYGTGSGVDSSSSLLWDGTLRASWNSGPYIAVPIGGATQLVHTGAIGEAIETDDGNGRPHTGIVGTSTTTDTDYNGSNTSGIIAASLMTSNDTGFGATNAASYALRAWAQLAGSAAYAGSAGIPPLVGLLIASVDSTGSGAVSDAAGIFVKSPLSTGSGATTDHYGILIEDIAFATNNYAIKTGAGIVSLGGRVQAPLYSSTTNCSDSAGDAACSAAPAGSVVIDAGDTNTVVSTTAVTANSQVLLQFDASLGTRLSVTCNTTPAIPQVTARSAGTSFTITVAAAPVTNPMCLSFVIIN